MTEGCRPVVFRRPQQLPDARLDPTLSAKRWTL
jgi:hypothetical protein